MWVKEVTRAVYSTKEDLAEDVVSILREESSALRHDGADFLQLDEPVLTELVFAQGRTRTFMRAVLAARNDPAEELEFAVTLINRVLEGFDDLQTGLLCAEATGARTKRPSFEAGGSWPHLGD